MINKLALDNTDRHVLYELDLNARLSSAEIGRRLGLSKETTANRIKSLERRGLISGYMAIINIAKLGRTGYAVFAQLSESNDEKKLAMIRVIAEHPLVYWVCTLGGSYDLVFALHAKSIVEFDNAHSALQQKIGVSLKSQVIAPRIEVCQFKRDYLISRPSKKSATFFGGDIEQETIDNLDSLILNHLAIDARAKLSDIAAALDRPRSTIQQRIAVLENRGIIQDYYTQIHAENFHYQIYQILITSSSKDREFRDALYQYSYKHPNITFFVRSVGKWDFELSCEVANASQLQKILSELRNKFSNSITNIEIAITFNYYLKWGFSISNNLNSNT